MPPDRAVSSKRGRLSKCGGHWSASESSHDLSVEGSLQRWRSGVLKETLIVVLGCRLIRYPPARERRLQFLKTLI